MTIHTMRDRPARPSASEMPAEWAGFHRATLECEAAIDRFWTAMELATGFHREEVARRLAANGMSFVGVVAGDTFEGISVRDIATAQRFVCNPPP